MRTLFEREVYIRLSEDGTQLVSTTRYGRLFQRVREFVLTHEEAPETAEEKFLTPLKKRLSFGTPGQP